ncbi:hypothetical protein AWENTII_008790 [Aspergillus wentii]
MRLMIPLPARFRVPTLPLVCLSFIFPFCMLGIPPSVREFQKLLPPSQETSPVVFLRPFPIESKKEFCSQPLSVLLTGGSARLAAAALCCSAEFSQPSATLRRSPSHKHNVRLQLRLRCLSELFGLDKPTIGVWRFGIARTSTGVGVADRDCWSVHDVLADVLVKTRHHGELN